MGTKASDGGFVTAGGRVLMVISEGSDIADARSKVYEEIAKIRCSNLFCRSDIAHIALER
jgi:phosphoribosylamine--glycine ligase